MKEEIVQAFSVLWKGMLAVFVAMLVIFIAISIMNCVTKRIK